jgi:hypothetical protein
MTESCLFYTRGGAHFENVLSMPAIRNNFPSSTIVGTPNTPPASITAPLASIVALPRKLHVHHVTSPVNHHGGCV